MAFDFPPLFTGKTTNKCYLYKIALNFSLNKAGITKKSVNPRFCKKKLSFSKLNLWFEYYLNFLLCLT